MSLDQDDETIYADFNAEAYNDLIEYQFSNIVKLMTGLGMGESIQEKVLKALSANLASLMVVENWEWDVDQCECYLLIHPCLSLFKLFEKYICYYSYVYFYRDTMKNISYASFLTRVRFP